MQLTIDQVTAIIQEIEMPENVERKKRELSSEEIYSGNLKQFVQNRIQSMYPKTYDSYTIADYSLIKKVTEKKAKAYKETPVRTLSTDAETTSYQEIAKDGRLNEKMKKLDKLYNQHKYALMGVMMEIDEDTKQPEWSFMPLAPYEFDVVKDADGCPKIVILSYPDRSMMVINTSDGMDTLIADAWEDEGAQTKIYTFWTESSFYVVKHQVGDDGKSKGPPQFVPVPTNPDNVNPYGVMPFYYVPETDGPNYPTASPLAEQTVEINALMSVYLTSGNMQIGQLVLKYPDDQNFTMVSSGLMTGIRLPQSSAPDAPATTAEYISPSPNMDAHRTSIMTFIAMVLDEQGIRGADALKQDVAEFKSGLDRMIAEADVQDSIEDNQGMYRFVEMGIFDIVKAQANSLSGGPSFSDKTELNIVYKKPRMLVSDTELLTNLQMMIDIGLLEPWEKFTIVDPNMTEDEAKEKLERIQEAQKQHMADMADAAGQIVLPKAFPKGEGTVLDGNNPGPGNQGNQPQPTGQPPGQFGK